MFTSLFWAQMNIAFLSSSGGRGERLQETLSPFQYFCAFAGGKRFPNIQSRKIFRCNCSFLMVSVLSFFWPTRQSFRLHLSSELSSPHSLTHNPMPLSSSLSCRHLSSDDFCFSAELSLPSTLFRPFSLSLPFRFVHAFVPVSILFLSFFAFPCFNFPNLFGLSTKAGRPLINGGLQHWFDHLPAHEGDALCWSWLVILKSLKSAQNSISNCRPALIFLNLETCCAIHFSSVLVWRPACCFLCWRLFCPLNTFALSSGVCEFCASFFDSPPLWFPLRTYRQTHTRNHKYTNHATLRHNWIVFWLPNKHNIAMILRLTSLSRLLFFLLICHKRLDLPLSSSTKKLACILHSLSAIASAAAVLYSDFRYQIHNSQCPFSRPFFLSTSDLCRSSASTTFSSNSI